MEIDYFEIHKIIFTQKNLIEQKKTQIYKRNQNTKKYAMLENLLQTTVFL